MKSMAQAMRLIQAVSWQLFISLPFALAAQRT
jgi:hypothetical protein